MRSCDETDAAAFEEVFLDQMEGSRAKNAARRAFCARRRARSSFAAYLWDGGALIDSAVELSRSKPCMPCPDYQSTHWHGTVKTTIRNGSHKRVFGVLPCRRAGPSPKRLKVQTRQKSEISPSSHPKI